MATSVGPIKQAFVRALRDITALKAAVGSEGIDEGVSLTSVSYPRIVYTIASTRRDRAFGSEGMLIATIDCWAVSDDSVEASNLDQLMLEGLEDVSLDFSDIASVDGNEPSTLFCRRLRDLSSPGLDDAGTKVYRSGGTYQVRLERL
jgi:hypothetical protein